MHALGIRLRVIGDTSPFDKPLRDLFKEVQALTVHNTGLTLTVAVNYGGRWDMLQAFRRWMAANPAADPDAISEAAIEPFLSTSGLPDPDLLIRTGGEVRVSNFMLWQMAYTEMYFTDLLFPAFTPKRMDEAISWFGTRDRRFGAAGTPASALLCAASA